MFNDRDDLLLKRLTAFTWHWRRFELLDARLCVLLALLSLSSTVLRLLVFGLGPIALLVEVHFGILSP